MSSDITFFEKVMHLEAKELCNNYFCWLYPFTNENISGYYSKMDFKDKKVLAVTGSGDHILNAFLLGTKEVDAFDINPLAKYYVELKLAAVKTLSLEEFILFFYNKSTFRTPNYYLNKKLYSKIKKELKDKYLNFWDYVFSKYTPKELYKSCLFTDDFLSLDALLCANQYMQDENYEKLKGILFNKKVSYHDIGLQDLGNLDKKFDIVVFSNVPAFLNIIYETEQLKNFKELIDKIKYPNTKIVVSYLYSSLLECGSTKDDIYNSVKLRDYFSKDEYEYLEFISSDNLTTNAFMKRLFLKFDKVFVSK